MNNKLRLVERMDDYWVYPKLSNSIHKRASLNDGFFTFLKNKDVLSRPTTIYIHIPFCDSRCFFCPYYKAPFSTEILDNYVHAVLRELGMYANTVYFKDKQISAIHFGGGNPFLLSVEQFSSIISFIRNNFNFIFDDNITSEGSVNCINSPEYAAGLLDAGISRFSLGIQTFDPDIRRQMHIHSSLEDIYKSTDIFNAAGIEKYCFDLMYNLPNQSDPVFIHDLELIDALNPYHIDLYNMAIFPNTRLSEKIRMQDYKINPSNENNIRQFDIGRRWLAEHGYRQIITNTFSKYQNAPDIGDSIYLNDGNVLGIGASSRGYIDGYAYKNILHFDKYIAAINRDLFPAELSLHISEEELDDRKIVFFPILMRIKKDAVSSLEKYRPKLNDLITAGLLYETATEIGLTDDAIPWSGNISDYLMNDVRHTDYLNVFISSYKNKTNPYNEDYMGIE